MVVAASGLRQAGAVRSNYSRRPRELKAQARAVMLETEVAYSAHPQPEAPSPAAGNVTGW